MEEKSNFECRVCFEEAKEPVVTQCGHLYCWGCMNKWLSENNSSLKCPVCKSGISKEKIIPIFVKGDSVDPRAKGVPRPRPDREAPQPNPEYSPFSNIMGGLQFNMGFGIFSGLGHDAANQNDPRLDGLSKIILIIGMIILFSVIF